ncbi:MAG: hypothetical protein ACOYCD_09470 [Kiritimatiellia bacterium]|jgi:hypothetical protein
MRYKVKMFAWLLCGLFAARAMWAEEGQMIRNPYAGLDWDKVEYMHSMSHQHGAAKEVDYLYSRGYRHFPISNYYPSKPFYPAPEKLMQKYPDAVFAPNAEQHSCTDINIHWNAVGSFYTTGGRLRAKIVHTNAPFEHVFTEATVYDPDHEPWRSIYWTDIRFKAMDESEAEVKLTVDGALAIDRATGQPLPESRIYQRSIRSVKPIRVVEKPIMLRVMEKNVRVRLDFDPAAVQLKAFSLAQGVQRPWRDAFSAALDGALRDGEGKPLEGLQYADGGGITINHPGLSLAAYLPLLDFDPRVLGIEVWNDHYPLGGQRGADMGFYELWDNILRTGRRCFGFFVNDHQYYGRGRNVLLVPPMQDLPMAERERNALRAYRQGRFFGLVSAAEQNASATAPPTPECSRFRFTRIAVRRDQQGQPLGLEAAVTGADPEQRPNLQIRFVTDAGVARVMDGVADAYFEFPRDSVGVITCKYVRVEAFAYPKTHNRGQPLTAAVITGLNVYEVSCINDNTGWDDAGKNPPGTVDMIFSQPVMIGAAPTVSAGPVAE